MPSQEVVTTQGLQKNQSIWNQNSWVKPLEDCMVMGKLKHRTGELVPLIYKTVLYVGVEAGLVQLNRV